MRIGKNMSFERSRDDGDESVLKGSSHAAVQIYHSHYSGWSVFIRKVDIISCPNKASCYWCDNVL